MFEVQVKWKDGRVTHDTYNDPYTINKKYTEKEIRNLYKNNDKIDYINISTVTIKK